jgi:hypothetical protein
MPCRSGYLAGEDGRFITGTAQFIDKRELNPPKPAHRTDATKHPLATPDP